MRTTAPGIAPAVPIPAEMRVRSDAGPERIGPDRGHLPAATGYGHATMTYTPDDPESPQPEGQVLELAGRRRVAIDELAVTVERGARVLVFSDLRLTNSATDISREVCRSVARAIEECRGPATIVFSGDVFDLRDGTDVEGALLAHPRLASGLAAFLAGADHRLVVLPGVRDSALAHDTRAIDAVGALGGEVALTCVLEVDTGVGGRLVHVEPGHRLDPSAAYIDPRDPNDRPLAQHLAREIGPGSRRGGYQRLAQRHRRPRRPHPRGSVRRVAVRVPAAVAPLGLADHPGARRARTLLVLLRADRPAQQRKPARPRDPAPRRRADIRARGRRRGAGVHHDAAPERARRHLVVGSAGRGNDDARGEAVTLAAAGGVGLMTAHTRRPELTDLGGGSFYANVGSGGRVVECVPARAGLPPVFVERMRCSWVELEAGAELHARLWHGVRDLPSSSWIERVARANG